MAETTRAKLPYPGEGQDPWYRYFEQFCQAVDAEVWAGWEDRGYIIAGGGVVSWSATTNTLAWAETIEITSSVVGFLAQFAADSLTIQEGEYVYWIAVRAPTDNVARTFVVGNHVPATGSEPPKDAIVFAFRRNGRIYFRNGRVLGDGQAINIFDATTPGGLTAPVSPTDNNKVAIAQAGDLTYAFLADANVSPGADIDVSKLLQGTDGQYLATVGTTPTWVDPPGLTPPTGAGDARKIAFADDPAGTDLDYADFVKITSSQRGIEFNPGGSVIEDPGDGSLSITGASTLNIFANGALNLDCSDMVFEIGGTQVLHLGTPTVISLPASVGDVLRWDGSYAVWDTLPLLSVPYGDAYQLVYVKSTGDDIAFTAQIHTDEHIIYFDADDSLDRNGLRAAVGVGPLSGTILNMINLWQTGGVWKMDIGGTTLTGVTTAVDEIRIVGEDYVEVVSTSVAGNLYVSSYNTMTLETDSGQLTVNADSANLALYAGTYMSISASQDITYNVGTGYSHIFEVNGNEVARIDDGATSPRLLFPNDFHIQAEDSAGTPNIADIVNFDGSDNLLIGDAAHVDEMHFRLVTDAYDPYKFYIGANLVNALGNFGLYVFDPSDSSKLTNYGRTQLFVNGDVGSYSINIGQPSTAVPGNYFAIYGSAAGVGSGADGGDIEIQTGAKDGTGTQMDGEFVVNIGGSATDDRLFHAYKDASDNPIIELGNSTADQLVRQPEVTDASASDLYLAASSVVAGGTGPYNAGTLIFQAGKRASGAQTVVPGHLQFQVADDADPDTYETVLDLGDLAAASVGNTGYVLTWDASGEAKWAALPGGASLTPPADPGDDNKVAFGSSGDLDYADYVKINSGQDGIEFGSHSIADVSSDLTFTAASSQDQVWKIGTMELMRLDFTDMTDQGLYLYYGTTPADRLRIKPHADGAYFSVSSDSGSTWNDCLNLTDSSVEIGNNVGTTEVDISATTTLYLAVGGASKLRVQSSNVSLYVPTLQFDATVTTPVIQATDDLAVKVTGSGNSLTLEGGPGVADSVVVRTAGGEVARFRDVSSTNVLQMNSNQAASLLHATVVDSSVGDLRIEAASVQSSGGSYQAGDLAIYAGYESVTTTGNVTPGHIRLYTATDAAPGTPQIVLNLGDLAAATRGNTDYVLTWDVSGEAKWAAAPGTGFTAPSSQNYQVAYADGSVLNYAAEVHIINGGGSEDGVRIGASAAAGLSLTASTIIFGASVTTPVIESTDTLGITVTGSGEDLNLEAGTGASDAVILRANSTEVARFDNTGSGKLTFPAAGEIWTTGTTNHLELHCGVQDANTRIDLYMGTNIAVSITGQDHEQLVVYPLGVTGSHRLKLGYDSIRFDTVGPQDADIGFVQADVNTNGSKLTIQGQNTVTGGGGSFTGGPIEILAGRGEAGGAGGYLKIQTGQEGGTPGADPGTYDLYVGTQMVYRSERPETAGVNLHHWYQDSNEIMLLQGAAQTRLDLKRSGGGAVTTLQDNSLFFSDPDSDYASIYCSSNSAAENGWGLKIVGGLATQTGYDGGYLDLCGGQPASGGYTGPVNVRLGGFGGSLFAQFAEDAGGEYFALGSATLATGGDMRVGSDFTLMGRGVGGANMSMLVNASGVISIGQDSLTASMNFACDDTGDMEFYVGSSTTFVIGLAYAGVTSSRDFRFYAGSNYVGFKAPGSPTDVIWTLPAADSTGTQYLRSNGSGTLSWGDVGTGDVVGPAGGTADGNIAVYDDATGKLLRNSPVNIDGSGNVDINGGYITDAAYFESADGTTPINGAIRLGDGTAQGLWFSDGTDRLALWFNNTPSELVVGMGTGTGTVSDVEIRFSTESRFVVGTADEVLINATGMSIRNGDQLRLYESDNTNYIAFHTPTLGASDYSYTLPSTGGTSGQVLQTSGGTTPTLSWVDQAGGITTPGTTTTNAIATWGDTTGDSLLNTTVTVTGTSMDLNGLYLDDVAYIRSNDATLPSDGAIRLGDGASQGIWFSDGTDRLGLWFDGASDLVLGQYGGQSGAIDDLEIRCGDEIRFYIDTGTEEARLDAIGLAIFNEDALRLHDGAVGSDYVALKAASGTGTWTMTLPTNAGADGEHLVTNGSGVTSWEAATAGQSGGGILELYNIGLSDQPSWKPPSATSCYGAWIIPSYSVTIAYAYVNCQDTAGGGYNAQIGIYTLSGSTATRVAYTASTSMSSTGLIQMSFSSGGGTYTLTKGTLYFIMLGSNNNVGFAGHSTSAVNNSPFGAGYMTSYIPASGTMQASTNGIPWIGLTT